MHFACHGLADQSLGNLFGALAVTPGSASDPADDGFLSLAEIHELNLKRCELAVLSACETNAGPRQRGEGTWALSRGFLAAGSRRVVASNWTIDDKAAATLIAQFCAALAQNRGAVQTDYAGALHRAQLDVRGQTAWQHPYYWSSFVLIGP